MSATRLRAILLLALACPTLGAGAGDPPAATSPAKPGSVLFASDRGPVLLGWVDAAGILAAFPDWPQDLEGWQPEPAAVATLTAVASPVDIVCVLGTWCGDSQREVPRFWRLLEAAANPNLRLVMVAVGRADDAGANRALAELGFSADFRGLQRIEKVPTFIFARDGQEIGRIIEIPAVSLEADMVSILSAAGLVPDPAQDPGAGWR